MRPTEVRRVHHSVLPKVFSSLSLPRWGMRFSLLLLSISALRLVRRTTPSTCVRLLWLAFRTDSCASLFRDESDSTCVEKGGYCNTLIRDCFIRGSYLIIGYIQEAQAGAVSNTVQRPQLVLGQIQLLQLNTDAVVARAVSARHVPWPYRARRTLPEVVGVRKGLCRGIQHLDGADILFDDGGHLG